MKKNVFDMKKNKNQLLYSSSSDIHKGFTHVQQFVVAEGHLRWDSLGEYLAMIDGSVDTHASRYQKRPPGFAHPIQLFDGAETVHNTISRFKSSCEYSH